MMNNKVLTISIAAYNVAPYIRNALESLVSSEIIDDVEVFIVDDGGKDESIVIAQEYENRFPNTFHAIHKENAGYGSTVNYSIEHATGKYFKLLDGDDWYDSNGLKKLVSQLKRTDADIIISNFKMGPDENNLKLINYYEHEGKGVKQLAGFVPKKYFGMWPMTIKTEVLRSCGLKLPEHELYTDQYFCTYPLAVAKTIQYINCAVYCYRTDRNGQSTSKEARLKHIQQTIDHAIQLTHFCAEHRSSANYPIILKRVGGYHSGAINTMLLKPICKKSLSGIKKYEKKVKSISKDVYIESTKAGETGKLLWLMRHTGYLCYWFLKPIHNKIFN